MTFAQVVETSVTNNSSFQNYTHWAQTIHYKLQLWGKLFAQNKLRTVWGFLGRQELQFTETIEISDLFTEYSNAERSSLGCDDEPNSPKLWGFVDEYWNENSYILQNTFFFHRKVLDVERELPKCLAVLFSYSEPL